MSFFNENIGVLRGILLALLLVAIISPWSYDLIHVPAEWPCDAPFVRLEGDFCGTPILGITMVSWYVFGFPQVVWALLTGEIVLASLAPELLPISLILLVILPVLTTFFLLLRRENRRLRLLHALALLLAAGAGIWWVSTLSGSGMQALWGMRLYFGLVMFLLILEGLALVQRKRAVQGT